MHITLLFLSTHMDIIAERGWPREAQLRHLGLTEAYMADPRGTLDAKTVAKFYDDAIAELDDPLLLLKVGNEFQTTSYDKWAAFTNYSGSVKQAWEVNARYQPLAETLGLCQAPDPGPEETTLKWTPYFSAQDNETYRTITEVIIGGYMPSIRWLLWMARGDLSALTFRHSAAAPLDTYKEEFGLDFVFDAPDNAVILKNELLNAPLPTSNPQQLADLTQRLDYLLLRQQNSSPLRQSLEAAIRTSLGVGRVRFREHCPTFKAERVGLKARFDPRKLVLP